MEDQYLVSTTPEIAHLARANLEQAICNIWMNMLNIQEVNIDDDFYALGGDSLSFIYMLNALDNLHLALPFEDAVSCTTIREIVQILEATSPSS